MSDTDNILVYTLDRGAITLPRSQCVFTDRSRGITRDRCGRRAYFEYEYGGRGLQSARYNQHTKIGQTLHTGLDDLLMGDSFDVAWGTAHDYYVQRPKDETVPEEVDQALWNDDYYLTKGMLWAFNQRMLPDIRRRFKVVAAEEEINWLLGMLDDGRYLVMMSRPDGVWLDEEDRLWHVSYKTAKYFKRNQLQKLFVDRQKWSEGYAIQAKYGRPVAGTLYYYYIKGGASLDKELGVERWTSGLVRPWHNKQGHLGGAIDTSELSYAYEWYDEVERRDRRLGKGWSRVSVYTEMEYEDYLLALDDNAVMPFHDLLSQTVAGPIAFDGTDSMAVLWNEGHARRWMAAQELDEKVWKDRLFLAGYNEDFDTYFKPMDDEQCFAYTYQCPFYGHCWQGKSLEQMVADGRLKDRDPNHRQEYE